MPLRRQTLSRVGARALLSISAASLTLFICTSLAVQAGAANGVDSTLQSWIQGAPWGPLDVLTDAANSLGERRQLALGALSIAIVLMWDRRDAFGMLATSVVGPFGQFLKTIMERPCPSRKTAEAASVAFCHSYPSGHVIFCTWLGLMLAVIISKRFPTLSPILGLLAIGLVTIMSIARMEAGAHLPSDVAGGIFLAVAWCGFVLAAMRAVPRFD